MGASGEPEFITSRPAPSAGSQEALIRPILAGVCSTDLEIAKGYMGFAGVMGHEFVGVVEKAPGSAHLVGKRVVGEINIPCGHCSICEAGLGNHCPTRAVLGIVNKDGAFADYFTLPAQNLHIVPDNVSDIAAVFTEPLAAALRILEQVNITSETKVAVLGAGRLGQLIIRVMTARGIDVTAISRSRGKLDLLKNTPVKTALDGQIDGESEYNVVVDSTGAPEGLARAIDLVEPCGTIVLKTTVARPAILDVNKLVIDEINVVGSRCGPFDKALASLAAAEVDVTDLVSEVISLDKAGLALQLAARPETLKIVLEIN